MPENSRPGKLGITREQAEDMAQAHAEGWHADLPREGCPECEDRPLRDYPRAADA